MLRTGHQPKNPDPNKNGLQWKQEVRAARDTVFKTRFAKCRRMLNGTAYRKVMRAGLVAAALYGTEMAPIDERICKSMLGAVARADGSWTAGAPSCIYTMTMGAKADPGFTAMAKVVLRVAREMWFLPTLGDKQGPSRCSKRMRAAPTD